MREEFCEDCNMGGTGHHSPYYKSRYGVCDNCSGQGYVVVEEEDDE